MVLLLVFVKVGDDSLLIRGVSVVIRLLVVNMFSVWWWVKFEVM